MLRRLWVMRFRPVPYPVFLLYELFRLYILMEGSTDIYLLPLSWYAGLPLLAVVPALFFMLSANEEEHRRWLPLIAVIKALGIPAYIAYAAEALKTAFSFGAGDDGMLIKSIIAAVVFVIGDAVIGVYCFGRNRILCR